MKKYKHKTLSLKAEKIGRAYQISTYLGQLIDCIDESIIENSQDWEEVVEKPLPFCLDAWLSLFGRYHTDFKIPVTTFKAPKDSWYQITWQEDGCDPKTESKYLKTGDIIKVDETLIYIVQLDKPEAPKEETKTCKHHKTQAEMALLLDLTYEQAGEFLNDKPKTEYIREITTLKEKLENEEQNFEILKRELHREKSERGKQIADLKTEKITLTEIVTQQAKQIQNLEAENQNLKEYIKLHKMFRNL